jgi:hypothetical protein
MLNRSKALKPRCRAKAGLGSPISVEATPERQERIGRREAQRLVEWKKLWRLEAYGRKWRETKPQGLEGIKPLRG